MNRFQHESAPFLATKICAPWSPVPLRHLPSTLPVARSRGIRPQSSGLVLGAHGLIPSMSRAGDCWDNAVAESFFATLKAELVEYERYPTRAAAIASIGDYIDKFYNLKRRHSRLAYMSPIEFELKTYVTARAS